MEPVSRFGRRAERTARRYARLDPCGQLEVHARDHGETLAIPRDSSGRPWVYGPKVRAVFNYDTLQLLQKHHGKLSVVTNSGRQDSTVDAECPLHARLPAIPPGDPLSVRDDAVTQVTVMQARSDCVGKAIDIVGIDQ